MNKGRYTMLWFRKKNKNDDLITKTCERLRKEKRGSYVQSGVAHLASAPNTALTKRMLSEVISKTLEYHDLPIHKILSDFLESLDSVKHSISYEGVLKNSLDKSAAEQSIAISMYQINMDELESYRIVVTCLIEHLKNANMWGKKTDEITRLCSLDRIEKEELLKSWFNRLLLMKPV